MRKIHFLTFIFLFLFSFSHAQIIIEGTIKDATNNENIIGALISIKGLNLFAISEIDGTYQLVIPTPSEETDLIITVNNLGFFEKNEIQKVLPIDDGESISKDFVLDLDPLTLKDVTITANKVEEFLQNVPMAATVITADDMRKRTVSDTDDAFETVPNLVYESFVPTRASISLRGLSSDFVNVGVENSVGLYIDDVYYSRASNFNSTLIDIERIEVLRGPQGTLFGKNTIGGVLHIISEDPKMANFGSLEVNAGNFNYLQFRGKGNILLAKDKLALRLSGAYRKSDGYLIEQNPSLKDQNKINFYGGRASLLYLANDKLKVSAKVHYSKDNSSYILNDYKTPDVGDILNVPENETDHLDRKVNSNDGTQFFDRESYGAVGRIEYKLGKIHKLTSITSYNSSVSSDFRDLDGTSVDAIINGRDLDINTFTQELRITTPRENRKLFYVAGLFFLNEQVNNDDLLGARKGAQPAFERARGFPAGALNIIPDNYMEDVFTFGRNNSSSFAGYFSTSYEISERIRFNGGLRYTSENKNIDFWRDDVINWAAFPNGFFNNDLGSKEAPIKRDTSIQVFSGNIGMEFKTTDDILLFVNFSRGFKGPGFNVTFSRSDDVHLFKPEFINSYEFGLKMKSQNRYLFNAALFVTDFRDKQESVAVGNSVFVSNAKAVQGQGIEMEFTGIWNKFFKTHVAMGALNMKYTDFPFVDPSSIDPVTLMPTDTLNLSGNRAYKAPNFNFRFSPELHAPLGKELTMMLRVDYNYISSIYNDIFNTESLKRKGAGRVNLRLAIATKNQRFEVAIWGKNLTDVSFIEHGFGFNFSDIVIINPPRTLGVELRANFY